MWAVFLSIVHLLSQVTFSQYKQTHFVTLSIMTFANFDLYYHMANHYRKIREAKAIVDCSCPKGYNKNSCGNYLRVPQCPTPCTRPIRSCSPESTTRRSCTTGVNYQRCRSAPVCSKTCQDRSNTWEDTRLRNTIPLTTGFKGNNTSPNRNVSKNMNKAPVKKVSKLPPKKNMKKDLEESKNREAQEHEYLHFLLNITEDILRSNTYVEKDMDKLFESHIKANKDRLDEDRMRAHVQKLKKELNLPLPQTRCVCEDKTANCNCIENNEEIDCPCRGTSCPNNKFTKNKERLPIIEEKPSLTEDLPIKQHNESSETDEDYEEENEPELELEPQKLQKETCCKNQPCTAEECAIHYGQKSPNIIPKTSHDNLNPKKSTSDTQKSNDTETEEKTDSSLSEESIKSEFTEEKSETLSEEESYYSQPEKKSVYSESSQESEKLKSQELQKTLDTTSLQKPKPNSSKESVKSDLLSRLSVILSNPPALKKQSILPGKKTEQEKKSPPEPAKKNLPEVKEKPNLESPKETNSKVASSKPKDDQFVSEPALEDGTYKTLKIQGNDENEDYVLVPGPVCVPRSMLEANTISIVVENRCPTTVKPSNVVEPLVKSAPEVKDKEEPEGDLKKTSNTNFYPLGDESSEETIKDPDENRSVEPVLEPIYSDVKHKSNMETDAKPTSDETTEKNESPGDSYFDQSLSDVEIGEEHAPNYEIAEQDVSDFGSDEESVRNDEIISKDLSTAGNRDDENIPSVKNSEMSESNVDSLQKDAVDMDYMPKFQETPQAFYEDDMKATSTKCEADDCPQKLKQKTMPPSVSRVHGFTPDYSSDLVSLANYLERQDVSNVQSENIDQFETEINEQPEKENQSEVEKSEKGDLSETKKPEKPEKRDLTDFANKYLQEAGERSSIDTLRKYHFLLVDKATSTSSRLSLEVVQNFKIPSAEEVLSEPEEVTSKPEIVEGSETVDFDYRTLLEPDYETETKNDQESVQDSLSESVVVPNLIRSLGNVQQHRSAQNNVMHSDAIQQFITEATLADQNITFPARNRTDSITPSMIQKQSVSPVKQEEVVRTVSPFELVSTHSFPSQSTVSKESTDPIAKIAPKSHEGMKVRYSVTNEFIDPHHLDLINKLDNVPPTIPMKPMESTSSESIEKELEDEHVAIMNEKIKAFRKVEDNNDNRRFQFTNLDNFEIRRVSLVDNDETLRNVATGSKAKSLTSAKAKKKSP